MTRKIKVVVACALLFGVAGSVSLVWTLGFHSDRFKVRKAHKLLAAAFRESDTIVLRRLSSDLEDGTESLSTWSHPEARAIVSTHRIVGSDAADLARLFSTQIYDENGTACHYPGFHLDFLKQGQSLVEFTLCFECMNLDMNLPWIGPHYVGFISKDFLEDENELLVSLLAITER